MKFLFKKTPKDAVDFYVLDFLDMKFTITLHREDKTFKTFAGFRSESGQFVPMHDYKNPWRYSFFRRPDGSVASIEEQLDSHMLYMVNYIMGLYTFDTVEIVVEDLANMLLEQWLES